jgi:hypothetical protein
MTEGPAQRSCFIDLLQRCFVDSAAAAAAAAACSCFNAPASSVVDCSSPS